ncbi:MAG: hypothetical protein Q4F00_14220, partial [bacterium]|nr:hypothetical protein [bacterium]
LCAKIFCNFMQKGLAKNTEGRNKGRAEERLNNLKQVLYGKFGDIAPDQLEAVLKYRDEPNLFSRIIKADSLEELLRLPEAGES